MKDGQSLYASNKCLDDFLLDSYQALKINYPKFYKMDNLSKLGFLAAEVLLSGRNLAEKYSASEISCVLSNAHASLDTDVRYAESTKIAASPALFVYTLPNIVIGEICIRHKLKGENAFFVSPSFNPFMMVDYVDMVLSGNRTQVCLAGWVDCWKEQHDVFLYLVEKNIPSGLSHDSALVESLYNK